MPARYIKLPNLLTDSIPQSIQRHHDDPDKKTTTLRQTAWLDGLRGVSALLVVFHHLFQYWYPELHGAPSSTDSTLKSFLRWPPLQFFYKSGSFSVACFFIISGYSLSWKPISLARAGCFEELYDSLASSVFRRPFRLFIPPAVTTLLSMPAIYFNWFPHVGPREAWNSSLLGCTEYYIAYMLTMINPFSAIPHVLDFPDHFPHLWTMAVEFRGSMIIFLLILALSKLAPYVRLSALGMIVVACFAIYDRGREAIFIVGLILCELQQVCNDSVITLPKAPLEALLILTFVACLLFRAYTTVEDTALEKILAIILVLATNYSSYLQTIFTTRFAQYLGRISFSLYMIHGVVLFTLCDVFRGWFGNLVGIHIAVGGDAQLTVGEGGGLSGGGGGEQEGLYTLAMFMTACVSFPVLFLLSDLTARSVDDGAVKFAGWLWRVACSS